MKPKTHDYSSSHVSCPVCNKIRRERMNSKEKNAIMDIAEDMVKQLANNHIIVQDTSEGRSAQRHWYLEAEKLLKKYVSEVKNAYK